MSRRHANAPAIPQCPAYFDPPEDQRGEYNLFRAMCCLEVGHDGHHENDLMSWPTPEKVAEGYKVFDPSRHEHFCSKCGLAYICNEMICERPIRCEKCKGGKHGA